MNPVIEDIEERIDQLQDAIGRSRKLIRAGYVAMFTGIGLFAGWALNLFASGPAPIVSGIGLTLGGLVLAGSSKRSTDELMNALRDAENERLAAIDGLPLVDVEIR
jgi:hypothetical protein